MSGSEKRKEQKREYMRRYRQEHPDKVAAAQQRYDEKHPSRKKHLKTIWAMLNHEKVAEHQAEYYRRHGAELTERRREYQRTWAREKAREKRRRATESAAGYVAASEEKA